jgi:glycosyltransferase involved in cell wall biosynthesis
MKLLLVNAKPSLADALATRAGLDVVSVWRRRHDFSRVPPPTRAQTRFYSGGSKFNLRAVWQMRRILQSERPDIVHAFYGRALTHVVLASVGLRRRPQIVSFRGIVSPLRTFDAGDWFSYRHPDVVAHACESQAVRESLVRSGIERERCWVTYNTMYHAPVRRPGRDGLAEFGIPPGAFVVGTVASMRRVKRIDLLLEAAIGCADLEDTYWLLLGEVEDPRVARLAADPRIRRRVRLVGYRSDASELISGADLFVMPSRSEALCQALLEAMHQGVCPVVSDAGGMKEVVRDGQDGLVVPAENSAALTAAIRTLHGNRSLAVQRGASARQRIAESFTPDAMADRALAIYRALGTNDWLRHAA